MTRFAKIPDPIRVSRYRRAPELGPRLLFFSGGSALNDLSRVLKRVFHIDIAVCKGCGGAVEVIASIEDPGVIKQILVHLERKT